MKPKLSFFLTATHWQVFLILVGSMAAGQIVLGKGILIPTLFFIVIVLGWLWTLGRFLSSVVNPELRPRIRMFRFAVLYPGAYLVLFAVVVSQPGPPPGWTIPLHLLATFCMFYSLYFVARSLRLAELQEPVGFYEYLGPLFLLWFFPVGIWFVQPRINRLYALRRDAEQVASPVA